MSEPSQQIVAQSSGAAVFVMVAMVGMLVITLFMTGLAIFTSNELLETMQELSQCRTSILLNQR